jgi:hypothetical protein
MIRRLSSLTHFFKFFQAETAHIYLAFAVACGHAGGGDRRRTRFYANADSASRPSPRFSSIGFSSSQRLLQV